MNNGNNQDPGQSKDGAVDGTSGPAGPQVLRAVENLPPIVQASVDSSNSNSAPPAPSAKNPPPILSSGLGFSALPANPFLLPNPKPSAPRAKGVPIVPAFLGAKAKGSGSSKGGNVVVVPRRLKGAGTQRPANRLLGLSGRAPRDPSRSPSPRREARKKGPSRPCEKFLARLSASQVYVPNQEAASRALKFGIVATVRRERKTENLHAVSAAARTLATREVFRFCAETKRWRMQSIYGSPRDAALFNELKNGLSRNPMQLSVYRPLITGQDLNRVVELSEIDPNADALYCVDVYETEYGPVTPALVSSLLTNPKQVLIWIGHRFSGLCGTVFDEGAWVRVGGKIRFRADKYQQDYPDHDPCDWIWASDHSEEHGISWAYRKFYGDYGVVIFHKTTSKVVAHFVDRPRYSMRESLVPALPANPLLSWAYRKVLVAAPFLMNLVPKRPVFVDVRVQAAIERATNGRIFDGGVFREVVKTVHNLQNADSQTAMVEEFFPGMISSTVDEQVIYGFFNSLPRRLFNLEYLELTHGSMLSAYNLSVRKLGSAPAPGSSLTRYFQYAALGLLSLLAARYLVPKVLESLWFRTKSFFARQSFGAFYDRMPILSACFEESVFLGLSAIDPLWAQIYRAAWLGVELVQEKSFASKLAFGAIALVGVVNPYLASVLHVGWNAATVMGKILSRQISRPKPQPCDTLALFKNAYHSGQDAMSHVDLPSGSFPYEPSEMIVERTLCNLPLPAFEERSELQYKEDLVPDPVVTGSKVFWPMFTSFPFFVPSTGDHNLLAVVRLRILKPPPMAVSKQRKRWACMAHLYPESLVRVARVGLANLDWDTLAVMWLKHFDSSKKKKYEAAHREFINQGKDFDSLDVSCIELFTKSNEKIVKEEDGNYFLKPRAIANVPAKVQIACGPYIWWATKSLKMIFNVFMAPDWRIRESHGKPQVIESDNDPLELHDQMGGCVLHFHDAGKDYSVSLSWGIGRTDAELSHWMAYVQQELPTEDCVAKIFVIVAGDDSLVCIKRLGLPDIWIEGDAGMFDQSQSVGPLRHQWRQMERFGIPKKITSILERVSYAPYLATGKTGTIRVDRSQRPTRDTGGADTTFGNTFIMGSSWVEVARLVMITEYPPEKQQAPGDCYTLDPFSPKAVEFLGENFPVASFEERIRRAFASLGFDMKFRFSSEWTIGTFLKGSWYPTDIGPAWGPLPSRVLKVGGSLRDPTELFKRLTPREAGERYLQEQALALKPFLQVPLVRKFVKANSGPLNHRVPLEAYKVEGTGDYADAVINFDEWHLPKRYDLDLHDFMECEEVCSFRPFELQSHPVLNRIGKVDYS